jgi:hypothetical protein
MKVTIASTITTQRRIPFCSIETNPDKVWQFVFLFNAILLCVVLLDVMAPQKGISLSNLGDLCGPTLHETRLKIWGLNY